MKADNVIKLKTFRPDTYIADLTRAINASKLHLEFIKANQDSCYDQSDIVREWGYQEGLELAQYLYKRRRF